MNSKFFELKKEKQDRMINAALKVFGMNGYRHAGTDEIVREAAVSKGLLFHYFENKIGAYTFSYDYSVRYLSMELKSNVDPNEKDMFTIIRQMELAHMTAMRGYPYMRQFIIRSFYEDVSEALLAIETKRNAIMDVYEAIGRQMDFSLLPPETDGEKLRNMLDITINGLLKERLRNGTFQPEMHFTDVCAYLDMVKKLAYH